MPCALSGRERRDPAAAGREGTVFRFNLSHARILVHESTVSITVLFLSRRMAPRCAIQWRKYGRFFIVAVPTTSVRDDDSR